MKTNAVIVIGISSFQKEVVEKLLEAGIRVVGIGECDDLFGPLVFAAHCETANYKQIVLLGGIGIVNEFNCLEEINFCRIREMLSGVFEALSLFSIAADVVSDCFSNNSVLRNYFATSWMYH